MYGLLARLCAMSALAALPAATLAVNLIALSVNPPAVIGGGTATGTVTLSAGALPGGVEVTLSSEGGAATMPASVIVPEGATSATFNIVTNAVVSRTTIIVTATYGAEARTATLTVNPPLPAAVLDIDGDGSYDPLTDGLLVLRYLFGIRDSSLTGNALGINAPRKTPQEITDYLDWVRAALDIDEDGVPDALTDGLMILRFLSGVRGDALISGAIGTLAQRKEVVAIEDYLTSLTPAPAPVSVVINEVSPNVLGSRDLVELLVTSGGSLAGMTLELNLTGAVTLASFPAIFVATGDLIVVHLTPTAGEITETTSKQDCSASTCFDGAWDIVGAAINIPFSNRILVVRGPGGIIDAVPFFVTGNTTTTFPEDLQALQAAGYWLPANCGGSPCTYASTPTATEVSVDWTGSNSFNSVQRKPVADTNTKGDWNPVGVPTFGSANP